MPYPHGQCRFSTLCRVGFGGAHLRHEDVGRHRRFSTLCRVGFGGAPKNKKNKRAPLFQYPLSGRVWWSAAPFTQVIIILVSVPSVGSGLVEQNPPNRFNRKILCFSTLCRVGFGGAPAAQPGRPSQEAFQYPLSGRVWWSVAHGRPRRQQIPFQYPLSGRVWWSITTTSQARAALCFSTLCRVGFGGAVLRIIPQLAF